ncbi:MAG: PSD1 and planctomycete cytochrome C domain-containing protein [Pirellulaceae bacterium]
MNRRSVGRLFPVVISYWLIGSCSVLFAPRLLLAEARVDFNRDIRPLLSDKCFKCHGPDDHQREAGLRLDRKESALAEADSGLKAVVPGDVASSELIARITTSDESLRMPPAETNKDLTDDEIALLRRWIEEGAGWQELWSLLPPHRPALPQTVARDWGRNAVDRFVLAGIEAAGLAPSLRADKVTLIRRVTFDLTGLPPTRDELERFLADDSDNAYERLVDRLLQSPRYGEHMARFWLDAARYGDTHGLHLDNYREMWPYRDWVVQSFNDNQPYDQFVMEQMAGDLLPDATDDQTIATGFIRCNVTTSEGGSIEEEVRMRNVVDRVVTTATVFMGATFECTRCHDHKYDPYTMEDFYSLYAFFNSIDGSPLDGNVKDHAPVLKVYTRPQQQQRAELNRLVGLLQGRLEGDWLDLDQQQAEWEQRVIAYRLRAQETTAEATAEKGESPQRSASDSDLSHIQRGIWYSVGPFADEAANLYKNSHGPQGKPVALDATYGKQKLGWVARPEWKDGTVMDSLPQERSATFLYRELICDHDCNVTLTLGSDDGLIVYLNEKEVVRREVARAVAADQDRVRVSLKAGPNTVLMKIINSGGASGYYFDLRSAYEVPNEIGNVLDVVAAERSDDQRRTLRTYFRNEIASNAALDIVRDELKRYQQRIAEIEKSAPTTLIWREKKEPEKAFFLKRGDYDKPDHEVVRRTPLALPPMSNDLPRDRLGLARWLLTADHPLTARVAVNRFWQQVFGTGIVKTAEDFGSQGSPPTHPELLDWLSVEFRESGWDIKRLMKLLVMSDTYCQSSVATPELLAKDARNKWYARAPRFRLDAEMLRDQALSVSGLLIDTMGGPSVKPPQPDLWFSVGYSGSNTVHFVADEGVEKVHRRTLYTFIKRTSPPPQMSTFDGPSRESCVMRRERTNTPLQALLMLNDPQYFEAAVGLAERTIREIADDDCASRAAHMFRLATCREPTPEELRDVVDAYGTELEHYRQNTDAAKSVLKVGTAPVSVPDDQSAAEMAAWSLVANVLLNTDEVVSKN